MGNSNERIERSCEALGALDELLQHPIRLGVCVLLAEADRMSFSRLKDLLQATDGNLGAQLRKMEETGYLDVHKEFVQRKPVSWYSLSGTGRDRLRGHLAAMESIVRSAKRHASADRDPESH